MNWSYCKVQEAQCYFCHQNIGSAEETVQQCFLQHTEKELAILYPKVNTDTGKSGFKAYHFPITPALLLCNPDEIVFDMEMMAVKVPQQFDIPPVKVSKGNTQCKVSIAITNYMCSEQHVERRI